MKRLMLIAAATSLLFFGCGKKDKDNKQPDKPVAAAADAGGATATKPDTPPAGEDDKDDVPVPSDFEDEATKELTADNLESEVKKLEDELPED